MHVWTHLKEDDYELTDEIPVIDRLCYEESYYQNLNPDYPGDLCNLSLDPANEGYYAEGKTGLGLHVDGMVEHDMYIGQMLGFLEEQGLKDNTIVVYTTDNGAETFTWPDGGTTPFRSEKATNWEGGYRVPLLIRWPGVIKGGFVSNTIISLLDFVPTLMAAVSEAAGERIDIKAMLMRKNSKSGQLIGYEINGKTYKVHLDGYDFLDYFRCVGGLYMKKDICSDEPPRKEFFYANDDGILTGIRVNQWKIGFYEQRQNGLLNVWQEPFTRLRMAKLVNLRTDPFERADWEASDYDYWRFDRIFLLTPAQVLTFKFLQTFQDFPPRQAPPTFSIDIDIHDIIEKCGTVGDRPELGANCFGEEEFPGIPGGG